MGFRCGEMDRGDGSVFFDENRVLELAPVSGLCAVLRGRVTGMGLDDHRLVLHLGRMEGKRALT